MRSASSGLDHRFTEVARQPEIRERASQEGHADTPPEPGPVRTAACLRAARRLLRPQEQAGKGRGGQKLWTSERRTMVCTETVL